MKSCVDGGQDVSTNGRGQDRTGKRWGVSRWAFMSTFALNILHESFCLCSRSSYFVVLIAEIRQLKRVISAVELINYIYCSQPRRIEYRCTCTCLR
jgi:hypothetical protein